MPPPPHKNLQAFDPEKDTVLDVFARRALVTPGAPYLVVSRELQIDYGSAWDLASRLVPRRLVEASTTIRETVQDRTPTTSREPAVNATARILKVAIISPNTPIFPIVLHALMSLGITAVPLSASAEARLWVDMCRHAGATVVLVARSLMGKFKTFLPDAAEGAGLEVLELESTLPHVDEGPVSHTAVFNAYLKWLSSASPSSSPRTSAENDVFLAPPTSRDDAQKAVESLPNNTSAPSSIQISPTTPIIILFTSSAIDASTLKCVQYDHAMVLASAWRTCCSLGFQSQGDSAAAMLQPRKHLGWLPLSHCFELTISLLGTTLQTGGSYHFFDPSVSSPDASAGIPTYSLILDALRYHAPIHTFTCVPSIISDALVPFPTPGSLRTSRISTLEPLERLEVLCTGGAPASSAVIEWATAQRVRYVDLVGATEVAGGMSTRWVAIPRPGFSTPEGEPGQVIMAGLRGVLEKDKDSDDFGELLIIGKHLPRRYENRPSDDPDDKYTYDATTGFSIYRTGDLYAHADATGAAVRNDECHIVKQIASSVWDEGLTNLCYLQYLGRLDDLVIFASGAKIDALAVERAIDSLPEVARSAVVASNDKMALSVLVEPSNTQQDLSLVVDSVLTVNKSLTVEKRLRRSNVVLVDVLPITTKLTLHRKLVKRTISDNGGEWPPARTRYPIINGSQTLTSSPESETPLRMQQQISGAGIPDHVRSRIEHILADTFNVPLNEIQAPETTLSDLSVTSLASVKLANMLREAFGCELARTQMYGARTVLDLCKLVMRSLGDTRTGLDAQMPPRQLPSSNLAPKPTLLTDELVITGAACRYPGGITTPSEFWEVLLAPQSYAANVAKPAPCSRWDSAAAATTLKMAWLDDAELGLSNASALASFFGVKPVEMETLTPNVRLVLQIGYQAIADAGIAPKSLRGRKWGVFTSVNDSGWRERSLETRGLKAYGTHWNGTADDSASGRLAYFLDLRGPAIEVKTACSSSAVAFHQACAAIRNGDCDGAVVVASTTHFFPASVIFRSEAGIASTHGRCATFSKDADGFLPAEGAVGIVIQRADDAPVHPYGKVRASVVAQDGRSQSFSTPSLHAQANLHEDCMRRACCDADDISMIEAHGTGTPVGDSIEIAAINLAYGSKRTKPLFVGSAKSVIGHTEECAGLTGLLKALLCFQYNTITPQANLGVVNKELDLLASKIILPRTAQAFISRMDSPRLIAVSSFGLSGTIAQIIVEESDPAMSRSHSELSSIFVLSAATELDFRALLKSYIAYLESVDIQHVSVQDACRTSVYGRDHHKIRRAWSVQSWRALADGLASAFHDEIYSHARPNPSVALWFPLQNSGESLPSFDEPVYRETMEECLANGCTTGMLFYAQQLAIARTLQALGCHVSCVGGEGPAEYVAAAFAGVLDVKTLFMLFGSLQPRQTHVYTLQCPHELLEESLLSYSPSDVQVLGYHDEYTCSLSASADIISELQNTIGVSPHHDVNPLIYSMHGPVASFETGVAQMPVVSSHLGEALEPFLVRSQDYWTSILERPFSLPSAYSALLSASDLVISLTEAMPHSGIMSRTRATARSTVTFADGFDAVIGRCHEAGCAMNWGKIVPRGPTSRMPTYVWST